MDGLFPLLQVLKVNVIITIKTIFHIFYLCITFQVTDVFETQIRTLQNNDQGCQNVDGDLRWNGEIIAYQTVTTRTWWSTVVVC